VGDEQRYRRRMVEKEGRCLVGKSKNIRVLFARTRRGLDDNEVNNINKE
jgi:hypothetical protein